jgi:hypothetical protein
VHIEVVTILRRGGCVNLFVYSRRLADPGLLGERLLPTVTFRLGTLRLIIRLMPDQREPEKWKAALTGALMCGVLGPAMGALAWLAIEAARQTSIREALSVLVALPAVLLFALIPMAPGAFLLGGLEAYSCNL